MRQQKAINGLPQPLKSWRKCPAMAGGTVTLTFLGRIKKPSWLQLKTARNAVALGRLLAQNAEALVMFPATSAKVWAKSTVNIVMDQGKSSTTHNNLVIFVMALANKSARSAMAANK